MIAKMGVAAVLLLVAGCAAIPNVEYHQLGPGPHHDNWVPFHLTDSIVVIGAPVTTKPDGDAGAPPVDLVRRVVAARWHNAIRSPSPSRRPTCAAPPTPSNP